MLKCMSGQWYHDLFRCLVISVLPAKVLKPFAMTNKPNAEDPPTPAPAPAKAPPAKPKEIGGPKGPEPTRFGDWEQKGRASDF
jgi:hypothetical protein